MLGQVLTTSKAVLDDGGTRQICSLRSPITPPPPSHHQAHLTLGHINTVLVLEDHGTIAQSTGNPSASVRPSSVVSATQSLTNSATVPPWTAQQSFASNSASAPIWTSHQSLSRSSAVPTWTSHVLPQANVSQSVPDASGHAPPQSLMFGDQIVAHPQTVNQSRHPIYLPPPSQFPQPHLDSNVHIPVTGKIFHFGQ